MLRGDRLRWRAQAGVSDCQPDKLIALCWVTILAGVKFEERGESGDVDIVIDDGVRLLDDHHARMWAREAPQDHSRCPECPTVVYFEGKAAVVAAKMLEAIRKEIGAFPTLQADDSAYVP